LYEELIVPLDGSALGDRALGPAASLASRTGCAITLVTVVRTDGDPDRPRRHLHEMAAEHPSTVGDVRVMFADDPALGILRAVHERSDTLLCMGTHGRGGLTETLLGSVAANVLRATTRPVLVVGRNCRSDGMQLLRMVAAVDGSPLSEAVLPQASSWVRELGLDLWVVQLIEADGAPPDISEDNYLRGVVRELAEHGVDAEWDVLHGPDAAAAVVDYGEAIDASVLAAGTHGRTGWERVALGSTAARLAHESSCPVLLVGPATLRQASGPRNR
jgi:nucleotide-binding universal stress UspA family protein